MCIRRYLLYGTAYCTVLRKVLWGTVRLPPDRHNLGCPQRDTTGSTPLGTLPTPIDLQDLMDGEVAG